MNFSELGRNLSPRERNITIALGLAAVADILAGSTNSRIIPQEALAQAQKPDCTITVRLPEVSQESSKPRLNIKSSGSGQTLFLGDGRNSGTITTVRQTEADSGKEVGVLDITDMRADRVWPSQKVECGKDITLPDVQPPLPVADNSDLKAGVCVGLPLLIIISSLITAKFIKRNNRNEQEEGSQLQRRRVGWIPWYPMYYPTFGGGETHHDTVIVEDHHDNQSGHDGAHTTWDDISGNYDDSGDHHGP